MLYWILVGAFPAKKTFECLKKPVKGETRHWCIFWTLFSALRCFDSILSFLPFFSIFSTVLLISNYNQHLSELTLKGSVGLFRYSQLKIKNHEMTTKILDKGQKFYKNNSKVLNKVKGVLEGIIAMFSSLNEGISNFSSQTLIGNLQGFQNSQYSQYSQNGLNGQDGQNSLNGQGISLIDNIIDDMDEGSNNRQRERGEKSEKNEKNERRIKSSPDLSSPIITLKSSNTAPFTTLSTLSIPNSGTSTLSAGLGAATLGNIASYITNVLPYATKGKEKDKEEDFFMSFDD